MHSVDHAVTVIGEILGSTGLALNESGQVELVFGEDFTAHLTRVDSTVMELSFPLPRLVAAKPSMMRMMLCANFLGASTGAGRLALDPEKDEVVYCERWQVAAMTREEVEHRLRDFMFQGGLWLTTGSDRLLEEGEADHLSLDVLYADYAPRDDEDPDQPAPYLDDDDGDEDGPADDDLRLDHGPIMFRP